MSDNNIKVSFIIPTFNADKHLEKCLKSIRRQDNQDILEVIVVDMGSTDRTVEIANKYKVILRHDPDTMVERREIRAAGLARGEFLVFLSADNELACRDWVRKMIKPFEEEVVYGAFIPIVDSKADTSFNKYSNLLQRDPFSWYVIGKVNPKNVTKKFPVLKKTEDYVVFDYAVDRCDLIAFYHQGFVVRKKYLEDKMMPEGDLVHDDLLPIVEMVKKGYKIAYVKNAGIHHHTLDSFVHFMRKFNGRMQERLTDSCYGLRTRQKYMCNAMKIRQYTWFLYSLTFIGPVIDMLKGFWQDKSIYWWYHPWACFCLSCSALFNIVIFICKRCLSFLGFKNRFFIIRESE